MNYTPICTKKFECMDQKLTMSCVLERQRELKELEVMAWPPTMVSHEA